MISKDDFSEGMLEQQLYDKIKRGEWLGELEGLNPWNRRHLYALFALFGTPPSMLDVGCGTGAVVYAARMLGIDAFGIDQLVDPDGEHEYLFHHDLQQPFNLQSVARQSMCHLVWCLEVAEHIDSKNHEILCDTLASHLYKGQGAVLIFSSAHPGQGGINHESERSAIYWRDKFHERGLNFRHDLSVELALLWSHIKSPMYWLPANVQVFEK